MIRSLYPMKLCHTTKYLTVRKDGFRRFFACFFVCLFVCLLAWLLGCLAGWFGTDRMFLRPLLSKLRVLLSMHLFSLLLLSFSDRWNILDFITLVIYLITFLLRMYTWATSASVTNNRALVIAGYLYGLNTMFLTLRAFGHVMETRRGIGAIQIALFQIIGDISTIFWQFLATILAFSIAITKVYMAEKSYIAQESYYDNL